MPAPFLEPRPAPIYGAGVHRRRSPHHDVRNVLDQAARRIGPRGRARDHPGGRRRGDRAGPRQGGAGGAGQWRGARLSPAVRGRCRARADHRARRGRRARAGAPRLRPCPRRGGAEPLFPGTQITFGPATDDGFYYDFAPTAERGPFTEEDLPAIEEEMRRIIARRRAAGARGLDPRRGPRLLREAGRDASRPNG